MIGRVRIVEIPIESSFHFIMSDAGLLPDLLHVKKKMGLSLDNVPAMRISIYEETLHAPSPTAVDTGKAR